MCIRARNERWSLKSLQFTKQQKLLLLLLPIFSCLVMARAWFSSRWLLFTADDCNYNTICTCRLILPSSYWYIIFLYAITRKWINQWGQLFAIGFAELKADVYIYTFLDFSSCEMITPLQHTISDVVVKKWFSTVQGTQQQQDWE